VICRKGERVKHKITCFAGGAGKKGAFEAIYEDNVWMFKPNSNDQNGKTVVEYLF
jgi:hypothetical protein